MAYWTALQILTQVSGELGLPRPTTITGLTDVISVQQLSMLNSSGNELLTYYNWEQSLKEYAFSTVLNQEEYPLPVDLCYFTDQTQWDRTNHWPLLGPKSAQEWAWLKGALVAALPRQRYRIMNDKLLIWPKSSGVNSISMEYISKYWVSNAAPPANADMVTRDSDVVRFDPWLMIKFIKFKFLEQKGFPTKGVQADFVRIFNALTGKDSGAPILSLSPVDTSPYLGPRSVQDGSWNVGTGSSATSG